MDMIRHNDKFAHLDLREFCQPDTQSLDNKIAGRRNYGMWRILTLGKTEISSYC